MREQMLKTKVLMDAEKTQTRIIEDEEGRRFEITEDVPDYKTQNEGLKRAMELTGTKIERTEHQHNVSGEIIHKYKLPEKEGF